MIRQARLFLFALQFMTRLPTPRLDGFQPDWIARSSPYYPVVGWIVGAISAAVLLGASRLWPGLPAAILAIAAGILVTGGFHEDGLADTADGLGGGQSPGRRLEIMKDSRIGSYGTLALWTALTLKGAALAALPAGRAAVVLIAIHGAARAYPVLVMASLRYAGDPQAAKMGAASMGVGLSEAILAVTLGVAPLFLVRPLHAVLGLILATILAVALALAARRLIGGFTGDILGAVEQLAEAGLLLGFSVAGLAG